MRIFSAVTATLVLVAGGARAQERYELALIRVNYTDTTAIYSAAQLAQATAEMEQYFSWLTNAQLEVHLNAYEVDVPLTRGERWHINTDGAWALHSNIAGRATNDVVLEEAVAAAYANGAEFSDVEGIILLFPFCTGDWANGSYDITVAGERVRVTRSYDFECGFPSNWATPGDSGVAWGAWAHEVGHQFQDHFGGLFGHPAGYRSGYDLMDSCYPCHDSAFAMSAPPVVSRGAQVFPGWLPAGKVVALEPPGTTPLTQTVVLAPLSEQSGTTTAAQAIQIKLARNHYFMVEARHSTRADSNNKGPGLWDDGIHILEVMEGRKVPDERGNLHDEPVIPVDWCDTMLDGGCVRAETDPRFASCQMTDAGPPNKRGMVPDYCWPFPLWHPGEKYVNTQHALEVRVDPVQLPQGYSVTVQRNVVPGLPDLMVLPWLTPPMNTYESVDLWVDSSCNGYEEDVGRLGLRYGRRGDGTVVGNGDDPCVNHDNRLYARITNAGDAPAINVVVTFRVTDPVGVGIRDARGFVSVGTATAVEFPALAELAPGASTVVWVTWHPTVSLTADDVERGRMSMHTCFQVQVAPQPGEINIHNQDGVDEQENVDHFEVRATPDTLRYAPATASFFLRNMENVPATWWLDVRSTLPPGWTSSVADGGTAFTLPPATRVDIPVHVTAPTGTVPGTGYDVMVRAYGVERERHPYVGSMHPYAWHADEVRHGGVHLRAHAVIDTTLSLSLQQTGFRLIAQGALVPARPGHVHLDFTMPAGAVVPRLAALHEDGTYALELPIQVPGPWTARALWQGDLTHGSAISPLAERTVSFVDGGAADASPGVDAATAPPPEDGGCSCRNQSGNPGAVLWVLLPVLLRRRR